MKKITLLLCVIAFCCVNVVNAQVSKGKILLGATSFALGVPIGTSSGLMNIGFGKTTYHSNLGDYYVKQTNFNLQPKAGYFFADKIAGGVELLFSSSSAKEEDETGKEIESLFLFGPFVRYYIPAGNLSAFLELEGGFGAYTDKWTGDNDYKDKHNVVAFGGGAGVLVPVGTKAGFDLSLGYNTYSVKYTGENPEDEKIVTGSFGIKLGFMLFLGGE